MVNGLNSVSDRALVLVDKWKRILQGFWTQVAVLFLYGNMSYIYIPMLAEHSSKFSIVT